MHDVEGWIVFLGCFVVLVLEIVLLQKIGAKGHINFDILTLPSGKSLKEFIAFPLGGAGKAAIITIVSAAVLVSFVGAGKDGFIRPVPLSKSFAEFPMQIGQWIGRSSVMDSRSLEVLGTDDYIMADYQTLAGDSVNLYILYYPKQDSTSNQAVHTPEVCIPGGGWEIASHDKKKMAFFADGQAAVNRLVIRKGLQQQLVYYWFLQGDTVSSDENIAKFTLIKNALLTGTANGAMIRVTTPVNNNDMDAAEKRLDAFIAKALPITQDFMKP